MLGKFWTRTLGLSALISSVTLAVPTVLYAQASNRSPNKAATNDEISTYMSMSVVTFCQARQSKVDFENSLVISISGQGAAVFTKHGGFVSGLKKKLSEKEFFESTSFYVVSGALKMCPKSVPAEAKKKYDAALEEIKKNSK